MIDIGISPVVIFFIFAPSTTGHPMFLRFYMEINIELHKNENVALKKEILKAETDCSSPGF